MNDQPDADADGELVTELRDSTAPDDTRKSFELVAMHAEYPMCAAPDCGCPLGVRPAFERILGGDIRGMAADWGTVGFCSFDCAEAFLSLNDLRVETDRDTIVHWGETVVAILRADYGDDGIQTVTRGLGHNRSAALEAIDDDIGALAAGPGYTYEDLQIEFETLP